MKCRTRVKIVIKTEAKNMSAENYLGLSYHVEHPHVKEKIQVQSLVLDFFSLLVFFYLIIQFSREIFEVGRVAE